ncbi:polysaccharide biosynthesis tyrosine autokinase [Roseinatronobacter alkalisoli]|uniref:Polysaccharide biosynthesis tyrosine autokinase n=1 Tax=Roseinatronobacter alkalisoli TaxID=3028235 RepID=A0ABT5TA60_9RHOB|nr:polysaccharide biosynthesis tyrosine autokinase [Roseinatronobacter sp. HJB301]MDD7971993.1 polysaccharide biosynthesis tyrosine autokinase [Roseinatronobacter sp. HJB301]
MTATQNLSDDEIDLGQLIGTLWRGKLAIAAAAALGIAIGAFHIANTNPTFQADALLQLEEKSGSLALPSSLSTMVDNDPRSVTEIEILRSRMVLGRAIADQNLDWRVSPDIMPFVGTMFSRYRFPVLSSALPSRFARPGDRIELENLVVPPSMLNQSFELIVTSETEYRLIFPDSLRLDGTVGQPTTLTETGFSITISRVEAPAGRRFFIRQVDERRAINDLRSRLSISERGRASGILEARLTGENRTENTRALEAVIQAYLNQNVSRSAAEAESSLTFIREQLPQAEQTLRTAEAALNAFRQEQVTVDLSLETQTILGQVTRIEGELADQQRREDELAQRFTPSHPTYRQLLDERARLEARLATLRDQVGALPETQRQILNLTREVELAQRIYTELLTRAQEVEVLRASTIGNVRIVDGASAAPLPIAPRKALILALSMVLGTMAGIAVVLVRNWMRKGVQDASELEKLGMPVFATINYNKDADTDGRRGGKLPILAFESSADLTVEAFRSLRTSLHFGMLDASTPSLTITSSHPGAGKSFLSVNLAAVAAQAGQRVCVIDADLRRGQLRRYFDLPRNAPGLAEVLAGDISFDDAVVQGSHENFFLLPTGRYPPNPSELLMRAELSKLIETCAQYFDLTIFDAPPVLAVTDPVILARNTGSTIFVARHDITPLGEVEAAQKTLSSAGLKFSGAVLNGFDPKKAGGRYGYGYGYRYEYKQRKQ